MSSFWYFVQSRSASVHVAAARKTWIVRPDVLSYPVVESLKARSARLADWIVQPLNSLRSNFTNTYVWLYDGSLMARTRMYWFVPRLVVG